MQSQAICCRRLLTARRRAEPASTIVARRFGQSWSAARSTASGWPMKPRALEDGAGQRASVVSLRALIARQGRNQRARGHHRVSAWCRQAPQMGRRRAGEAVGSCSLLWARTWRLPTMVTSITLVEPPADRPQPRRILDAADVMAKVDDDEARLLARGHHGRGRPGIIARALWPDPEQRRWSRGIEWTRIDVMLA